jgi:hypothetical protein
MRQLINNHLLNVNEICFQLKIIYSYNNCKPSYLKFCYSWTIHHDRYRKKIVSKNVLKSWQLTHLMSP